MKIRRAIVTAVAVFLPAAAGGQDAGVVIDSVWHHIGGRQTFAQARYIRFTWEVEREGTIVASRSHAWDRKTGDCVLRRADPETGDSLVVFFNIHTRKGTASRDGKPATGDELAQLCDMAYRAFINDMYWFLVPAKLEDPGVHVEVSKVLRGAAADTTVLHLHFDQAIGLTPGDQYWLYVLEDGRIVKWRYHLQSGHDGESLWSGEKDCGMGLVFATRKQSPDGNSAIVIRDAVFATTLDRSLFDPGPPR